jgi:hypothetical protein
MKHPTSDSNDLPGEGPLEDLEFIEPAPDTPAVRASSPALGQALRGCGLTAALALGCASYQGQERTAHEGHIDAEAGWVRVASVPLVRQRAAWDCGLAALTMVLRYWSIAPDATSFEELTRVAVLEGRSIRAGELRAIARAHGAEAFLFHATLVDLEVELGRGRPVLVGEQKSTLGGSVAHYAVVIGVHPGSQRVLLLDPALGLRENSYADFELEWAPTGRLALLVVRAQPIQAAEGDRAH